ncbi:amino acid deaminase/aldolase, partial [Mycobacterium kansasii]
MPEVGREQRADEPVRLDPHGRLQRYEQAFAALDAPFAFIDLDAMWANAGQLLSRAGD